MQLLEFAIRKKSVDIVQLIVQKCPEALKPFKHHCTGFFTPLSLACQQNLHHDLILLMIEKGLKLYDADTFGGLLLMDEKEVNPLQHLAGINSGGVNRLLGSLFQSRKPLLHPELIIKYNLDRIAVCCLAPDNFILLFNCLTNEMMKASMESVDKNGRGIIHHALKARHTNDFIIYLIQQRIRLSLNPGLYDLDHFSDMPMNVLLRTHYPRWPESIELIQMMMEMKVITKNEVLKYNLLHKIAKWPRCEICQQKAKLLLTNVASQDLLSKNSEGNFPINEVTAMYKDWKDIKTMLFIFIRSGLNAGVEGLGGLLLKNGEGRSVLEICMDREAEQYKLDDNPVTIISMMKDFSITFQSIHERMGPFLRSIMKLTPCKLLPELVTYFDTSVAFIEDEDQQLLVHIAARKGLTWTAGLEKIYKAFKSGLLVQDSQNCYPLMLAASSKKSDLATIYSLLREDPAPFING